MHENPLDLSRPLREKIDAHDIVVNKRRPGVYRIVSLRRPEVSRTVRGKDRIRKGVENTILHQKKLTS